MNISKAPLMVARLRADPVIQDMVARNAFQAAGSAEMIFDMNEMSDDYRRVMVERWCQTHATGFWRWRVNARRGYAVLDLLVVEFERAADATACCRWLRSRGW